MCGLVAGGEWVVPEPAPRIKESALTVAEKAKMRAHLAIIFSDDAVLGKRVRIGGKGPARVGLSSNGLFISRTLSNIRKARDRAES